ncbi:apoptosis facilitator Bcl-2-like protein 14 [Anabas testudineus]|uniref:apoptosis facilitator Bcl-2-like protein 14 n=1 Tax=Anabas testudineus TaxID=64144 RepID=UPI000E46084A|nr:apoptosis facilitator Bcl-2-like protein 14 [Anabas testudineus]
MMDMARAAGVKHSEVLLLLEDYCSRRAQPRSARSHTPAQWKGYRRGPAVSLCKGAGRQHQQRLEADSVGQRNVAERLVRINDSTPVPAVVVENQDELIQKLVELMMTFGDDINKKIDENPVLQEQRTNLNYNMFEKVTSSVQNLVQMDLNAESEEQIQQQKISWAFEVTSRLSATGVVQRRRVLSYGDQYIQQHHSDWVQQHGGWVSTLRTGLTGTNQDRQ